MNILVITDPGGIGGNFLTWTIYWLSGQQRYWHYASDKCRILPKNPLTKINSHNFESNLVYTYQQADNILHKTQNCPCDEINCIYLHKFDGNDQDKDTDFIEKFCRWADKIVYVDVSPYHHLYFCKYQGRVLTPTISDPTKRHKNWDDQFQEFIDTYFLESKTRWHASGMNAIWDQREFLALNMRPFEQKTSFTNAMSNREYFYLDSRDLWTCLDGSIRSLFDFFEIKVCEDRFQNWQSIYTDWRKVHHNQIFFGWYFDRILKNIIHGNPMDLSRFNLDIVQEACIQHVLIYKYGLNLKTWNLNKFHNTRQLYNLLEPNMHQIVSYNI